MTETPACPKCLDLLAALKAICDLPYRQSSLEAMAYSGGDVPKKWLREEAPVIQARHEESERAKAIARAAIARAEGRET